MRYGHENMIIYQNIDAIDMLVQREIIPRIPKYYIKTKTQIDSASDSVGANFVEGYYSGSLKEYLRFLGYSKRSLTEVHERVRRCLRKRFIDEQLYLKFKELNNKTMYLFSRLRTKLEEKL
ncbi:MAG: four helix bundle protein [bacterium]